MPKRDYYDILGLKDNASQVEIKRVYRDLAKQHHPDVNKGNKEAENRFKEISEAYNVLRDPAKRQKYDQMKKYGAFTDGGQPGGFGGFNGFDFSKFSQGGYRTQRSGGGTIIDELFGMGGMGDIFSQMFDQGSRTRQERYGGQQKSNTVQTELTIPFDLAVNGGKQPVSIVVDDNCKTCNGTGAEKGAKPKTCPDCQGRGNISISQGFFAVNRTCPRCYGRGILIDRPCTACNGSGNAKGTKNLSINIPRGISDGTLLRLKGMGNNGKKKGNRGDLIVKIKITPHRFYKRKGNDVYCEVPIDIIKAIQSTKIRVKTVYNTKVELKIPAGSKDSKTFRLKGLGINSNKGKGDLYVTIKVVRRTNLTDEEKRIVNEFDNNGKA
ncbi:molecular chaperone DnaJ [candidate division KSB1 bacterium]|nr:molecular chaperone DnaJ [candidate division KSB1 bacterium]MBL7094363.1 molecular chaperone DnaJ [candidate division KSB1 bacterium]